MKINLAFIGIIGALVVGYAVWARRPKQGTTGGTPAPALDPTQNVAITEAAYNQGASEFAAAFGADENTSGSEVTLLQ